MLIALVFAGMLVVPVALAMACGPQAGVFPNQAVYGPGEGGTFTGVNFTPGLSFSINIEGGATLATVTVPSSGSFVVGFTAPATAGSYVVAAFGTDETGNQLRSSPAQITVAAPATQPQPSADPAPADAPAAAPADAPAAAPAGTAAPAPAASAPATAAPAKQPAARQPAKRPAASAGPSRSKRPAARTRRPATTAATTPAAEQPAPAVFAGSVPRRSSAGATTRPATAASPRRPTVAAPRPAVPSESSGQSAAWSGLSTSREPALVPTGDFPATGTSANGTARTLSVLMLGLGIAALVGGVGVSEVRRRRAGVR